MSIERNSPLDNEPVVWYPTLTLPESPRPGCKPWAATPGDVNHHEIAENRAVVREQAGLALYDLKLRPPFANPESKLYVPRIDEFVDLVFWSRDAIREINNTNSYNHTLHDVADTDLDLKAKLEKAKFGSAKPGEILELIDELGMGSAELAKLTHIWGYRLEYLEAMRQQVKQAIREKRGDIYVKPKTKYGIIAIDTSVTHKDHLSIAVAMKRKTLVGRVGDTAIYERTTFIVRIDRNSHIDQTLAAYLRSFHIKEQKTQENTSDTSFGWKDQIMQDGRLVQDAIWLLAMNDLESVIPMSTTIFGRNDVNLGRLEVNREEERIKKKSENMAIAPTLSQEFNSRLGSVAISI